MTGEHWLSRYRLTLVFGITSMAVMAIAGVGLSFVIGRITVDNFVRGVDAQATKRLSALLEQSALQVTDSMPDGPSGSPLPVALESLARTPIFASAFDHPVSDFSEATLHRLDGSVAWSTAAAHATEYDAVEPTFESAKAGKSASVLFDSEDAPGPEGAAARGEQIFTYVPVLGTPAGDVIGVLEVRRDVSDELQIAVRETRAARVRILSSTLGVLYLALLTFLAYLDRRRIRAVQDAAHQEVAYLADLGEKDNALVQEADVRTVLARIGRVVTSSPDISDVYVRFTEEVRALLPFDRVVISLIEPDGETVRDAFVTGVDIPGLGAGSLHPLAGSANAHVVDSKRSLICDEETSKELAERYPGTPSPVGDLKSMLMVPLLQRNEAIGTLNFRSTLPAPYGEREVELAEQVSAQIAGAIVTSQLHVGLQREAREREVLAEIGRTASSSLDTGDIYRELVGRITEVVPADRIVITAIDRGTGTRTNLYVWGVEMPDWPEGAASEFARQEEPPGTRLAEVLEGKSVAIDTAASRALAEQWPPEAAAIEVGLRSALTVPITWQEELIGTMVYRSRDEDAYSPDIVALAERVSLQIAGAFASSRLFEQVMREAREREVLAEIGRIASSSLNTLDVFQGVAQQVSSIVQFDRFFLSLADRVPGAIVQSFVVDASLTEGVPGVVVDMAGSIMEQAIEARSAIRVSGQTTEEVAKLGAFGKRAAKAGHRSLLTVPLMAGEKGLGALHLRALDPDAFSEADASFMMSVASQVVGTISNADLHAEVRRQSEEREILGGISRIISSSLDTGEVFERFAEEVRRLVPFDRLAISAPGLEEGTMTNLFVAGVGLAEFPPGVPVGLPSDEKGACFNEWVRAGKPQPLILSSDQVRALSDCWHPAAAAVEAELVSVLYVPIRWEGKWIADLVFRSRTEDAYSEEHARLAERVAVQIAGSITSARLHAGLQREAHEREVLAEIGRIVSSSLAMGEVYERLSEEVKRLIPFERLTVAALDLDNGFMTNLYVTGRAIPGWDPGASVHVPARERGGTAARWVSEGMPGALILGLEGIRELADWWPPERSAFDEGFSSDLIAPIVWRNGVIGSLTFRSRTENAYSENDAGLAERIARQMAGAVANADLHADLQREAHEREVLAEIGRIVTSSHDIEEVFPHLVEAIGRILAFDRFGAVRVDRTRGIGTDIWAQPARPGEYQPPAEFPLPGTLANSVVDAGVGKIVQGVSPEALAERWPGLRPFVESGYRSVLGVPLVAEGSVFGALYMASKTNDGFSERNLLLAERVAAQISGAIVNSQLYADLEREAKEREVLAEIGRIVSSSHDVNEVFPRLVEAMRGILSFDLLGATRVDRSKGVGEDVWCPPSSPAQHRPHHQFPLPGTITETAIDAGTGMIVQGMSPEAIVKRWPAMQPFMESGYRSAVFAPLVAKGSVYGTLYIGSKTADGFTERDLMFAERVAAQISGAIVNSLLYVDLEREAREREVLAEIGRITTSSLDIEQFCERFAEQVRVLVPADRIVLTAVNEADENHTVAFIEGLQSLDIAQGCTYPLPGTITETAVRRRGVVLVDPERARAHHEQADPDGTAGTTRLESWAAGALVSRGAVWGVLHLLAEDADAYGERELGLIDRVVNQTAGAIANSQLHASLQHEAEEREVLAEIGRIVGSDLDIGEVYERFAEALGRALPFDRIVVALVDEDAREMVDTYTAGMEIPGYLSGHRYSFDGSVSSEAVESRATVCRNESAAAELAAAAPDYAMKREAGLRSLLIVPLIWQDRVVGTLNLHSKLPAPYGEEEASFAQRVGTQIAGAVANAQLHAQTLRDASERAVLAEIGRVVGSDLDIAQVYERFAKLVGQVMPLDRIVVTTVDHDAGEICDAHVAGVVVPGLEAGKRYPIERNLATAAIRTREVIYRNAAHARERIDGVDTGYSAWETAGLRATLIAPLIWQEQVVGSLNIHSGQPDPYGPAELAFVEQVAAQIAGAIAAAGLYADAEQKAREQAVVAEIGRIVTASLDMDTVYKRFAEQVQKLLPADRVVITLLDPDGDSVVDAYVAGIETPGYEAGQRHSMQKDQLAAALESRRPVAVTGAESEKLARAHRAHRAHMGSGLRSSLVAPLVWRGEVIGTLNLRSRNPEAYGDRDVRLAGMVADQIVGAVANSRLHMELAREAREREVLAEIGGIVSSTLEFTEIFEPFVEQVRKLVPCDRVVLTAIDSREGSIVDLCMTGREVPGWVPRVSRGLKDEGGEVIGLARVVEGESLVCDAEALKAAAGKLPGDAAAIEVGLISFMAVPIISGSEVIGSLNFRSEEEDPYTAGVVALAERIAAHVSGAIASSNLYGEVVRESREREALAEIGRIVSSDLDIAQVYERFAGLVGNIVPFDRIVISLVDEDAYQIVDAYVAGTEIPGHPAGTVYPTDEVRVKEVIESRSTICLNEIDAELAERWPEIGKNLAVGLKSFLVVPLTWQDRLVGTLNLSSSLAEPYGPGEIAFAEQVGAQIAVAVANAQLYEQTLRDASERALLADIGQAVSSTLDLQEVFEFVADRLRPMTPFDWFAASAFDREGLAPGITYTAGETAPNENYTPVPQTGTLAAAAVQAKHGISLDDGTEDGVLEKYPGIRSLTDSGARSLLAVPVIWEEAPIGVLFLASRVPNAYSELDVSLVERVAAQIAGTIASARLHTDLQREAREREVLAEIGRVVSTTLDLSEVCDRMTDGVAELLLFDWFAMGTVDVHARTLYSIYATSEGLPADRLPGAVVSLKGSLSESAIRKGSSLVLESEDMEDALKRFPGLKPYVDAGARSAMATPLLSEGGVVGVWFIASKEEGVYSERERELAERIGNQVAGAVASARLHADLEREAHEREALAEIGRIVGSDLEIGDVYERFSATVQELIPFDRIVVTLLEKDTDTLLHAYVAGTVIEGFESGSRHPLSGLVAERVVAEQRSLALDQREQEELSDKNVHGTRRALDANLGSFLGAPLIWRDEVIGPLGFRSSLPAAYGEHDLELAQQVSAQISGAVAASELYAQARHQAREREILAEIGRVIGSSLDIDEVYERFTGLARELIWFDRISITLLDEERGMARPAHVWGLEIPNHSPDQEYPLAASLTGSVVEANAGFLVQGEEAETLAASFPGYQPVIDAGIRSALGVPLLSEGRPIGVLHFASVAPDAYSPEDVALAERIGQQIAGAITNAELHGATERQSRERETLARIGQVFSSTLDIDQVYESFTELVRKVVPFDRIVIAIGDEGAGEVRDAYVSGIAIPGHHVGATHTSATSPVLEIYETREMARWPDPVCRELTVQFPSFRHAREAGLKSLLAAPLIWWDGVVGTLNLHSKHPDPYGPDEQTFIGQVATQIAGAVANARLHADLGREAREREVLAEMSRVVSSSPDVRTVYDEFVRLVELLIPADRVALSLYDETEHAVVDEFMAGVEIPGAEPGARLPLEKIRLEDVYPGREARIIDSGTHEWIAGSIGVPEERITGNMGSTISAPLVSGDETIGTFVMRSLAENAYSEEHRALMGRIAAQIAGAIANAQLHTNLQREAREREVLAEIGRVMSSSLDVNEVFPEFADLITGLVDFDEIAVNTVDLESGTTSYAYGPDEVSLTRTRGETWPLEGSLTGVVVESGEATLLAGEDPDHVRARFPQIASDIDRGVRSVVMVPLVSDLTPIGVLSVLSRKVRAFSQQDFSFIQRVGHQIAGTIASAAFRQQIRKMNEELEDRVSERTADLEEANAELEAFSYSISHDLRSPAQVLAGMADILLRDYEHDVPEKVIRYLGMMRNSAEEMSRLVEGLLEFSRAGRQKVNRLSIAPRDLVRQVLDMLWEEDKDPEVEVHVGDLPSCQGDPVLLRQVYANLLSNSLKFTRSQKDARIEVGCRRVEGENVYYTRDNGVGFEPAEADRLFDVFERLHRPTTNSLMSRPAASARSRSASMAASSPRWKYACARAT